MSVSPVRGASGGGSAGDLLLLCKINEIELHFEFINVKIIMCPLSQRYLGVVYKRCRQFGGGKDCILLTNRNKKLPTRGRGGVKKLEKRADIFCE